MPLFSEHITNMYYSGSPSYSSPYSSYTSSYSPLGTSYSASYLNPGGNYSSHSSIGSYSRAPLTSRWIPGLSRSYSPMLTPISERGTSSPVRISSPRRIPISKRSYGTSGYTQRPININTADIDVSRDKYRRKSIETPITPAKPPLQREPSIHDKEKGPFMPRVDGKPETGIDSSPGVQRSTIKRGRTVVRLHTVKRRERDSPRKPVETTEPQDLLQNASVENSVDVFDRDLETKPTEAKNWREKLSDDLAYPEKKEKKSLGTKFVENHLVKNVSEQNETKTSNNNSGTETAAQHLSATLQTCNELPCKSPDRRCSMELLAEQASVLDALIKRENLSTAPLDLSKVGVSEKQPEVSAEPIKRRKSGNKENPLKTTKSDQSLHENLKSLRNSKDAKTFSKRRSLKKSFSGGSISRLDSITELPKDPAHAELPSIEENRTSIENNKTSENPKPKLKTKITASVEISPPASPLRFKIENVTVEEKVHIPKKEITFSSTVEDSTAHDITVQAPLKRTKDRRSIKRQSKIASDPSSPDPEDGNFWDKIGKRETVYLVKRKQNLDEVKEKHKRAMFWFPEDEVTEVSDTKTNNDIVEIDNCSEIISSCDINVTQKDIIDEKQINISLTTEYETFLGSKSNNCTEIKIVAEREKSLEAQSVSDDHNCLQVSENAKLQRKNEKDNILTEVGNDLKLPKTLMKPDFTSEQNEYTTEIKTCESEIKLSASADIKNKTNDSTKLAESIENTSEVVCSEDSKPKEVILSSKIELKPKTADSLDASKLQSKISDSVQNTVTKESENQEKSNNSGTVSKDNIRTKKKSSSLTKPEKLDADPLSVKPQEKSEHINGDNEKRVSKINITKKNLKDAPIKEKPNSLTNKDKKTDITSQKSQKESELVKRKEESDADMNGENDILKESKDLLEDNKKQCELTINTELETKVTSIKESEGPIKEVEKTIQKPALLSGNNTEILSPVADAKPIIDKISTPKKLKSAKNPDSKGVNKNQTPSTSLELKDSNTVQICPVHGVVNKTDNSSKNGLTKTNDQLTSTNEQPAAIISEQNKPVDLLPKTEREPSPPTATVNNNVSPVDTFRTAIPQIPITIQSENIPKICPQGDSENVQTKPNTEIKKEESKPETKTEQENQTKPLSNKINAQELTPVPKRPVKEEKALKPLIATPRPLQKRVPQIIHSSDSSDSSSEEESSDEEEESDTSEGSTEFFECENNADGRTSTGSNDSGFDSSAPTSPASFMQIKKDCDVNCHRKCEKLTANLCGVNQRLLVEALATRTASKKGADSPGPSSSNATSQLPATDILEQELEQSTAYGIFRKTGRFTPPARSIPRFRKYMIEDFQFIKVLGKGSFGKVLLAELRDTEYYYAVKCLKKDVVLEDDDVECTLIERKVLALGTNHPYLCHLFATFQTDSHLFFVMEYLNGGDLMFHIQQSGRFPEARARFYAAEIVSGLKFLHKRGIVYRDLKLDNILLDFDGHVRIADFGMCKLQIYLDKTADTFCGTPDYMAPEIIKGLKYNQAVDWWSFGVLMYEMLIGQSPFSGCDEDELFWSICNEMPSYPRFLSQEALTILTRLLDKDARTRLGGAECMHGDVREQDFFHAVHWDRLERRELEAPFRPRVRHPLDTQYFDRAFTGERPRLTAVEPHVLRSMDQEPFRGFSYTNPNATDR